MPDFNVDRQRNIIILIVVLYNYMKIVDLGLSIFNDFREGQNNPQQVGSFTTNEVDMEMFRDSLMGAMVNGIHLSQT